MIQTKENGSPQRETCPSSTFSFFFFFFFRRYNSYDFCPAQWSTSIHAHCQLAFTLFLDCSTLYEAVMALATLWSCQALIPQRRTVCYPQPFLRVNLLLNKKKRYSSWIRNAENVLDRLVVPKCQYSESLNYSEAEAWNLANHETLTHNCTDVTELTAETDWAVEV